MESCGDICSECCFAQKIQTESGVGDAAFRCDAGAGGDVPFVTRSVPCHVKGENSI